MKVLLFLVIVGVLALGAAYFLGGVSGMNPADQVKAFETNVKEGMTWEEVVAVAKPQQVAGVFIRNGMPAMQSPRRFDADAVKQNIANNSYPDGFVFIHRFTNRDEFNVHFDSSGKVEGVERAITAADILEGKLAYPE